jgi:hypothetical protein
MPGLRRFGRFVLFLSLCVLMTTVAGCGGPAQEAATPIPIANPTEDNKFKDVTLQNESDNMKMLKQGTKAGPAPKPLGPALPGMPK